MHLPSLVVLLALLLPLSGPARAAAPTRLPAAPTRGLDDEVGLTNRFFEAGYTYCDARVLAGHWGLELWETKVKAGTTLAQSRPARLQGELQAAQARVRAHQLPACAFWDTGIEPEQAVALATLWGVSPAEAKSRIVWSSSTGDHRRILEALQSLPAGAYPTPAPEVDYVSTFLQSEAYDYCHAHMVAALWGADVREAKSTIGYKLATGSTAALAALLDSARTHARSDAGARCGFGLTPFLTEDAQALARLWGVDLDQAKARIEQSYLDGTEARVREDLRRAGRG